MSIITEALKKAAKEKVKTINLSDKTVTLRGKPSYKSENTRYKRRKRLIISGILLLVTIAFLTLANTFLLPSLDIERPKSMVTSDDSIETPVEAEAYTNVKSELALFEDKKSLMDNTAKAFRSELTIEEEFTSNFTLNGIVYDADDSWAIINNKVVRTGDTLEGANVLSIAPQKVVLLFKNERFVLSVK